MNRLKKLPIGIQNIREILEEEQLYVDKTRFVYDLIKKGKHYFLSRPRRFGKSLFLNTLQEVFRGNKDLFKGRFIYESDYDWIEYPVLHFDFAQIESGSTQELKDNLSAELIRVGRFHGISAEGPSIKFQLKSLIEALAEKKRVVILVDEYDHPIINNLKNIERAEENRDVLKGFFETFKTLDAKIKFTFITGVSKFSQVSIFSGLNNLNDITMDPDYAAIMGYTEEEMRRDFRSHTAAIVEKRNEKGILATEEDAIDEMRLWYNGYRFSEDDLSVYNPYSTLRYLSSKKAAGYWYASGTPSFLISQIEKRPRSIVPLTGMVATQSTLADISDLDKISLSALMFQTGYLTITDCDESLNQYTLGFPNKEVREAFLGTLIDHFADIDTDQALAFQKAIESCAIELLIEGVKSIIASLPYQLLIKASEATYHAIFLSILKGMALPVRGEEPTNLGRIDLLVDSVKCIYIIELKLDRSSKEAIEEIQAKKYYEPYQHRGKEIALIGINFSAQLRNISDWRGKLLSPSGEIISEILPAKRRSVSTKEKRGKMSK